MFKLIALFILIWIFIKAIGMIIKTVIGGGVDADRGARYSSAQKTGRQGDINIDHNPNKGDKGYKGGEYVDYEDVE